MARCFFPLLACFCLLIATSAQTAEQADAEIAEILQRLGKIGFPDLIDAEYVSCRPIVDNQPRPIGFVSDREKSAKILQFPIIQRLLKDKAIDRVYSWDSLWSTGVPPVSTFTGGKVPADEFAPRSLPEDAEVLRRYLVSSEPPLGLILSAIGFAHACNQSGHAAEGAALLSVLAPLVEREGGRVLGLVHQEEAHVSFEEAIGFLGDPKNSRSQAAQRFATVAKSYPGTNVAELSANYAIILEKMVREDARDPKLAGPEPTEKSARIRWLVHRLQDQPFGGYIHPGGPIFELSEGTPYKLVTELGVDAIPALLELDGDRLARWYHPGRASRWTTGVGTVEETACAVLFSICGERFETLAAARAWWPDASRRGIYQSIAEKLAEGERMHLVERLFAHDPQLTVRSLLRACEQSKGGALTELQKICKPIESAAPGGFIPNTETVAAARHLLGKSVSSIPWCAGVFVLSLTSERETVTAAARNAWRQAAADAPSKDTHVLVRLLILNDDVQVFESSWNQTNPERKITILEVCAGSDWIVVPLPGVASDARLREFLAKVKGDRTPLPMLAKPPFFCKNANGPETYATIGECTSRLLEEMNKAASFRK